MHTSTPSPATPGPFDDLLAAPLNPPAAAQSIPDTPAPPPNVAPNNAADPFADLLGTPIAEQLAHTPNPARGTTPTSIPDDFDPMALVAVSARNSEDPLAALDTADGDVNTLFAPPTVDAIYAPATTSIAPMLEDPLDPAQHGGLLEVDSPLDPLLLFGEGNKQANTLLHSADPVGAPPPLHNHTPERSAFFRAPEVHNTDTPPEVAPSEHTVSPPHSAGIEPLPADLPAPSVLPPDTSALPTHQSPPHDARELLEVLLQGAGLSAETVNTLTPDAMRALGQVLAASVQNALYLAQKLPGTNPVLEHWFLKIQQSVTFDLDNHHWS